MLGRNRLSWTCLCLGWLISLGCGGDPVDPLQEEERDLETSRLPVVESFEPTSAIPGSQVALHVHGQNFDAGSRVDLLLSGDVVGEVQTLSTRLVTSEELVADISIADGAPVGDYTVQVTTSDGKRGIPIEDFEVVVDRLPVVESFEPTSAIQGSLVSLHIHGQNFDADSRVDLLFSGEVIGEVQALSTHFLTSEELIADISIADSAPVGVYEIQVTTSNGKLGIASEDFEVVVDSPPAVELAFGVYDMTARIESFDPAWGIDMQGAFYTAVITLSRSPGLGGTFADWRFIGSDGEESDIGIGVVSGFADLQGDVVIEVERLLWYMEGRMLDSGDIVGSWGCCGHISGTFTALRRQQSVGSVTLLPDSLTVAVYDTAQLTVIVRDTTGAVIANPHVVFSLSSWPRASNGWTLPAGTVDSTGLVTGHPGGCGDGTVIARSQGVDSNTVHITVGSPSGEGCWDY